MQWLWLPRCRAQRMGTLRVQGFCVRRGSEGACARRGREAVGSWGHVLGGRRCPCAARALRLRRVGPSQRARAGGRRPSHAESARTADVSLCPRALAAGVPRLARQPHLGVCALQQRRRPRVLAAAREPGAAAGRHGPGERHLQVRGGERCSPKPLSPAPRPVPGSPPLYPKRGVSVGRCPLVWLQAP